MARVKYGSATFDLAIKGTQAEVTKAIVARARIEHEKIMTTAPRPGGFIRTVDGVRGAALDKVKEVVVFEYERFTLVAQILMERLFEESPVLTGDYRNSHTLFLNGAAVRNLDGWRSGMSVVIANFVPYSRKIEAGKMKMRVPGTDHVYQQVEWWFLNSNYSGLAKVKMTYTGVVGGAAASGKAHGKSENRYPALTITER